jgi:hypothetical protein
VRVRVRLRGQGAVRAHRAERGGFHLLAVADGPGRNFDNDLLTAITRLISDLWACGQRKYFDAALTQVTTSGRRKIGASLGKLSSTRFSLSK